MKYLIILFSSLIWLSASAYGQATETTKDNSLTVRGIAILKTTPELITVRIDIETDDEKFSGCQDKLIHSIEQTKSVFIKNGIEKSSIHSSKMNISEKRLYIPDRIEKIIFGGHASFFIEHTYSIEYAKKLLEGLQNDSLNIHYTLNFTLSEDQKTDLRKKAIKIALKDAREKAQAIAEGADVRLLRIRSINFTDAEYGGYSIDSDLVREMEVENQVFAMMGTSEKGTPTIDFNPKEIGIKKYVTVEWFIEEKK